METDENLYLPDLSQYITFEKCDDKGKIKIGCNNLFKDLKNRIQVNRDLL